MIEQNQVESFKELTFEAIIKGIVSELVFCQPNENVWKKFIKSYLTAKGYY
jgi:hypothetical protein